MISDAAIRLLKNKEDARRFIKSSIFNQAESMMRSINDVETSKNVEDISIRFKTYVNDMTSYLAAFQATLYREEN